MQLESKGDQKAHGKDTTNAVIKDIQNIAGDSFSELP